MAKTTAPAEKNDAVPPSPTRRAGARGTVYNNVLETIGGTPLVRTSKFTAKYNLNVDVLAKLEFFNPMSSIKDRSALAIIEAAENAGKIIPGKSVIIESSSGNMAISLAFVAAAKGYRIILVMPESVPLERRKLLLLYGAEVVLTAAERGMKGAIETAQTLMKNTQFSWAPDQFNNPAAIEMHASTTAEELWADTNGRIDILVAGVGTGATISGIAQALKQDYGCSPLLHNGSEHVLLCPRSRLSEAVGFLRGKGIDASAVADRADYVFAEINQLGNRLRQALKA